MRIATFNINSVRARLENLCVWLREQNPDVLLLQEIKCQKEQFPALELQMIGYESIILGQKGYNGVAILSKHPMQDVVYGLQDNTVDVQARYLETTICGMRIVNLYMPNGNPLGSDRFTYKIQWMEKLKERIKTVLLPMQCPLVIGGDFNVIPTDDDCYDPLCFRHDAAMAPKVRANYRTYIHLGLTDVFPALNPKYRQGYTFWDYQQGAWQKNFGLRIDMFLSNGYATDLLQRCWIDTAVRNLPKASDHVPVIVEFDR